MKEMSEQEKAVIFATCGELTGILAGISHKHELIVIPLFLWNDLRSALKDARQRINELEQAVDTQQNNLEVYERVLGETKEAFSATEPGRLIIGEQELVIPGVNGPRPEHAHLDRDTMSGIMRGKAEQAQRIAHPHMTRSGPPGHPHGKHKKRR